MTLGELIDALSSTPGELEVRFDFGGFVPDRLRSYRGVSWRAWSLFITGPNVRTWGFACPKGWVSWQQFVEPERPGEVGRGCGEGDGNGNGGRG